MDAEARNAAVRNSYEGINSFGESGIFALFPSLAEANSMRAWWAAHRCERRGEGFKIQVLFPEKLKGASVWCVNCLGCGDYGLGEWDAGAAAAEAARLGPDALRSDDAGGEAGPSAKKRRMQEEDSARPVDAPSPSAEAAAVPPPAETEETSAPRDTSLRRHCRGGCASEELMYELTVPYGLSLPGSEKVDLYKDVREWFWIGEPNKMSRCALGQLRDGRWVRFHAYTSTPHGRERECALFFVGTHEAMVLAMTPAHYAEYIAHTFKEESG